MKPLALVLVLIGGLIQVGGIGLTIMERGPHDPIAWLPLIASLGLGSCVELAGVLHHVRGTRRGC